MIQHGFFWFVTAFRCVTGIRHLILIHHRILNLFNAAEVPATPLPILWFADNSASSRNARAPLDKPHCRATLNDEGAVASSRRRIGRWMVSSTQSTSRKCVCEQTRSRVWHLHEPARPPLFTKQILVSSAGEEMHRLIKRFSYSR